MYYTSRSSIDGLFHDSQTPLGHFPRHTPYSPYLLRIANPKTKRRRVVLSKMSGLESKDSGRSCHVSSYVPGVPGDHETLEGSEDSKILASATVAAGGSCKRRFRRLDAESKSGGEMKRRVEVDVESTAWDVRPEVALLL